MSNPDTVKKRKDTLYESRIEELLADIITKETSTKIDLNEFIKSVEELNSCFSERFSHQEKKVAGSFYTNEALVTPVIERTLKPLIYGENREIKTPESILELKTLDPATGGYPVFLIASIRFLARSLFKSLEKFCYFETDSTNICIKINSNELLGFISKTSQFIDLDERIIDKKKFISILKVIITQNCIYGVDIDPVAVKLSKLNIIAEIGDITLDYKFLNNNIKTGNSLISCWSESFQGYPDVLQGEELKDYQRIHECFLTSLNVKDEIERSLRTIEKAINDNRVKNSPFTWLERREEVLEKTRKSRSFKKVKKAFDTWCSTWFWPQELNSRFPKSEQFFSSDRSGEEIVSQLSKDYKFFHWELEFPEVFFREDRGFDGVVGNPPWEIVKPHSREFFSRYDRYFWSYGKQEALRQQTKLFNNNTIIERKWIDYNSKMKLMINYFKNSAKIYPFDNTKKLKDHPYRLQGPGNLNYYRLFTELLLYVANNRSRLGLLLPAGIYSDLGSKKLRKYLMDTRWEWLFSFENKHGIFPGIHKSYKFCILIVALGQSTDTIKAIFNCHRIEDWCNLSLKPVNIEIQSIISMSPENRIISELSTDYDAKILNKIHDGTILLKDSSLKYVREYDMTNHSELFPVLHSWKEKGYRPTKYSYWENDRGKRALPLYEGRMIGQFKYSKKGWVKGKGRTAKWREITDRCGIIEPQYLMLEEIHHEKGKKGPKLRIAFIHVTAATNRRSMICSLNHGFPHGNSAPFFVMNGDLKEITIPSLFYVAYFNSYCFDYALRLKLTGTNLNWFVLSECPVIDHAKIRKDVVDRISLLTARLNMTSLIYCPAWLYLRKRLMLGEDIGKLWAVTSLERTRLRTIIDGVFAYLMELSVEELDWILRNDKTNIKGFWRVDDTLPEQIRHPKLVVLFYRELIQKGLDWKWEDWKLPTKLSNGFNKCVDNNSDTLREIGDWNECKKHSRTFLGVKKYNKYKRAIEHDKDPFTMYIW